MTPIRRVRRSSPASGVSPALVPTLVAIATINAIISSLGAPLIPTIARAYHVSLSTGEWVITAALLTGALATSIMGRLADGARQRNIIVVGMCAVMAGSVVVALSTSFQVLVVGRGLQGIGLGLFPVTMAIARLHLPHEEGSRAIATLSISGLIGVGLGYPLTSVVSDLFSYRVAFWSSGVCVAIGLIAALVVLPREEEAEKRPFDFLGAVSLSLAVTGILVLLSEGGIWGWSSPLSIAIFIVSVLFFVFWAPHELRVADPLVDLRQVGLRLVLTADISILLISMAMYLFIPIMIQFIQAPTSTPYGFGSSVLIAGFLMTPLSIGTFVANLVIRPLSKRLGVRMVVPIGAVIFAAPALFFALDHRGLWQAFVTVGVAGVGAGLTLGAMPAYVVRAVPASETGSAIGFYQVLQRCGQSMGSALAAAVLAAFTLRGGSFPSEAGFQTVLFIAAALCLLTAVVSFLLPGSNTWSTEAAAKGHGQRVELMMQEDANLGVIGSTVPPDTV